MLFYAGMERRVGKVSVTVRDQSWKAELAAVQKDCVVLRCEYRAIDDAFHMDLFHPDFAPIRIGETAARYDAELADTDEGIVRTGFKRR